jgi:hypothetical protein
MSPCGRLVRRGRTAGGDTGTGTRGQTWSPEPPEPPEPVLSPEPPLRSFLIGPHLEFLWSRHWGITGAATYRPMRVRSRLEGFVPGPDGVPREVQQRGDRYRLAVLWQFPVLVKYRFSGDRLRPFLEAGPSFRLPQDYGGNLSSFGAAAGAGVDFRWKSIHVEPGLRFSHFGPARNRIGQIEPNYTYRNQLDAVCVFRF